MAPRRSPDASRPAPALAGPGPDGAARPGILSNLQALRAVAALSVVLHHGFVFSDAVYGARGVSTRADFMLGGFGVAVFFVISGFLMARLVRDTDPWTFLAHRVVRIFPPFLAVVALSWLVFTALGVPFGIQPLALTLAPVGPRSYPLNIEWTLVFETSFYVGLFGLAVSGRAKHLDTVAAVWLVILAGAFFLIPATYRGASTPPPEWLPLAAPNAAFAAGLLLPRFVRAGLFRPPVALLAIPPVLLSAWVEVEALRWCLGLAAWLVVGCALQGRQIAGTSRTGRWALRFGDGSYLLYLAHAPIILLVTSFMPPGVPVPVVWLTAVAAALGFAIVAGPLDLRAYRHLRGRTDALSGRAVKTLGLVYLAVFFGAAAYGGVELWRERRILARAESALAGLPEAAGSGNALDAAIAARGIGLPATVRGGADDLASGIGGGFILGGWAFDTARPDGLFHLAVSCGGRRVALDRARRRRPDVAARPGLAAARGKRIGFRLSLPEAECRPPGAIRALLVDETGRIGPLPGIDQLAAPPPRP